MRTIKNFTVAFIKPCDCLLRQPGRTRENALYPLYHDGGQVGLTLVEVVVASALLILSLTMFLVSFVQSGRSAAISDNRLNAIHTAREKMETLGSYSYTAAELSAGMHNFSNGYYTASNNAAANVKDIVVVTWWIHPLNGITSTVSLAGSISAELHK